MDPQHWYKVVEYEQKYGGIILDCSQIPANIVSIKGEASRSARTVNGVGDEMF
jgi:hypothetical protein